MEQTELIQLAEEAMKVELNVSELYMIFYLEFQDDSDFWWSLVIEEKDHAALIRSGLDYLIPIGRFPEEIIGPVLSELVETNNKLSPMIAEYRETPPSRTTAFNVALQIETSAGEIHFQRAMSKSPESHIMEIFQQLNKHDKDHIKRLRAYMNEKGISVES